MLEMQKRSIDLTCLSTVAWLLKLYPEGFDRYVQLREALLNAWMRVFSDYTNNAMSRSVCQTFFLAATSCCVHIIRKIQSCLFEDNSSSSTPTILSDEIHHHTTLIELSQDSHQIYCQLLKDHPTCVALLEVWSMKLKKPQS
jgi:hypothetical protein